MRNEEENFTDGEKEKRRKLGALGVTATRFEAR